MRINIANLPPSQEIDHQAIRTAAAKHAAAQKALQTAQRELKAEWANRDAAESAAQAGRPAPKGSLVEYVQAVDDLQQKVGDAAQAAQDAARNFQEAVDEHGQAWADTYDQRAGALDEQWRRSVAGLIELYAERSHVHRRLRQIFGAETPGIGAVYFRPSELHDSISGDRLELAHHPDPNHRRRLRASVNVDDLLQALATVGEPIPADPMPGANVSDQIKHSFEHSRTVIRGFSEDEARQDRPAVRQMPGTVLVGDAVFHVPGNGGDD